MALRKVTDQAVENDSSFKKHVVYCKTWDGQATQQTVTSGASIRCYVCFCVFPKISLMVQQLKTGFWSQITWLQIAVPPSGC